MFSINQGSSQLADGLLPRRTYLPARQNVVNSTQVGLSILNGVLYFGIAKLGSEKLQGLLGLETRDADEGFDAMCVVSCVCYTMFFYKGSTKFNLMPASFIQKVFSFLGLFAASSFLTSGYEGALLFDFVTQGLALAIGVILFACRTATCVDASVKFPDRLIEIKKSWGDALVERNGREISRLLGTGLMSAGYALSSTDAVYSASEIILGWFHVTPDESAPANYVAAILGALGSIPMSLYWGHRGIKQLTFGGRVDEQGNNSDPTDRATYLSLIPISATILGVLGSAVAGSGSVFRRVGLAAQIIDVVSSVAFAGTVNVPGMSTLFRSVGEKVCRRPQVSEDVADTRLALLENAG